MSVRWLLWSLASPSQLLFAITIAGSLLVLFTGRRAGPPSRTARIGKALTMTGGLGLLLFGFLPVSHYLVHPLETRFPLPTLPAEVTGIILLSGSERPAVSDEYGEPQVGAHGSRYITALRLAARYPEARVVYTGGSRTEEGKGPLGTQTGVAAEILGSVGLDPARVTFDEQACDTCGNASATRTLVQPQAGETWVVVTSAMHMPRTIACLRAAGWGEVIPYPTDHKVVIGSWGAGTFQVADNLSLLDAAAHEWIGLVYYRLTRRTEEWFPGPT
ncbi:MAG: YdcF family protein [Steroidobacteraceae bacterium]